MMTALWTLIKLDILRWRRMPVAVLGGVLPPIAMALVLFLLSFTVGQEPVALVVQSSGPYAQKMAQVITHDTVVYHLTITNEQTALQMLHSLQVAAVITIPSDFDQRVPSHTATVDLTLNNLDVDFSDDIRRIVDRSVSLFNMPPYIPANPADGDDYFYTMPNPSHVIIQEYNLRTGTATVSFLQYQELPVLVFLLLNVGLTGTVLLGLWERLQGIVPHIALVPQPAWLVLTGRVLGGTLLSCLVLIPVLLIGILTHVLHPMPEHWIPFLALLLATAFCAAGLGVLLGTVLHDPRSATLAATVAATVLFFLGGGFTTIAFLPPWLQTLSSVIPMRYAIDGIRQTLFYADLSAVPTDLAVLVLTALCSILLAAAFLRRPFIMR